MWTNISTTLKAMFCSIVLVQRITATITCRNVFTFNTREMLASSMKVGVSLHQKVGSSAATAFGVS